MRVNFQSRRNSGFTLIELMISVAVGAMILMGAYACFSAAVDGQKMIEPRVDVLQTARAISAMITADLRSACALDKNFAFLGVHRTSGQDDADEINFATHHYKPAHANEGDFCEVSYYAEADPATGLLNLWRRRNPTLARDSLSGGRREPLVQGLRGVRFEYTDGLDWYDTWGQTNSRKQTGLIAQDAVNLSGMPEAVRITFLFPTDKKVTTAEAMPAVPALPAVPMVFQVIAKLELSAADTLSVAGGGSSSTTSTPQQPNAPPTPPDGGALP